MGNVYIKFRREEDAERAVTELNNRWFGGRPIYAELSPVTDFRVVSFQTLVPNVKNNKIKLYHSETMPLSISLNFRHVVANTKWENVLELDFVISCI